MTDVRTQPAVRVGPTDGGQRPTPAPTAAPRPAPTPRPAYVPTIDAIEDTDRTTDILQVHRNLDASGEAVELMRWKTARDDNTGEHIHDRGSNEAHVVAILEDAVRMLAAAKSQAQALPLDAGVRGMNAQLTAALHRVHEAILRLKG